MAAVRAAGLQAGTLCPPHFHTLPSASSLQQVVTSGDGAGTEPSTQIFLPLQQHRGCAAGSPCCRAPAAHPPAQRCCLYLLAGQTMELWGQGELRAGAWSCCTCTASAASRRCHRRSAVLGQEQCFLPACSVSSKLNSPSQGLQGIKVSRSRLVLPKQPGQIGGLPFFLRAVWQLLSLSLYRVMGAGALPGSCHLALEIWLQHPWRVRVSLVFNFLAG